MALKAESSRFYQNYEPNTEIVQEEDCDVLLISLPGFKKDQLKAQLAPHRILKISGERPIGGKKWIHFQKEYQVPTNCETNKITARFDGGILYIRQPKLVTPVVQKDEEKPEHEDQKSQEYESETQPPLSQTTEMKNGYEQRDETNSGKKIEDEDEVPPSLPPTTEMKNGYEQTDETKSGDKMEDEDKVASKSNGADDGDVAQKSQEEEEEPRKGGVDSDEKAKREDELKRGELMTGRVTMAQKLWRMMTVIVVVLSVVALGIYIRNLIMPAQN